MQPQPAEGTRGTWLCIQTPVCAWAYGRLVTESPAVVVSTPPGQLRPVMCAALARVSTDDRSSGADGSVHLGPVGPDAIEPAVATKSRRNGAPLLGARGVRAGNLDRRVVGMNMVGSLGDRGCHFGAENAELRRANAILRTASAFFAAENDRH